jgi:outer membrane receptor protein involved in Fe transport
MPSQRLVPRGRGPAAAAAIFAFTLMAAGAHAAQFQHQVPNQAEAGKDLVIEGKAGGKDSVRRVRVRFRRSGETRYEKADMRKSGKRFRAVIPGSAISGDAIEYFVVVQTYSGKVQLGFASPREPARVPVVAEGEKAPLPDPDPVDDPPPPKDDPPPPADPDPGPPPADANADKTLLTDEEQQLLGGGEGEGGEDDDTLLQPKMRRGRGVGSGSTETSEDGDLSATIAGAGQGDSDLDEELMEEFAVFAAEDESSLASAYAQRTSEAPAIISVTGRQRIVQMGARHLIDILKTVPGVETSVDITGFRRVAIRGLRKDARILLLVDGHRANNPYDGRTFWLIPAALIERVEVIRGPGSVLYGTGAFAGVINVVTRKKDGFDASVWGGSFNTVRGNGAGGGRIAGGEGFAAAEVSYTQGPSIAIEEDAFTNTGVVREATQMRTQANALNGGLTLKGDWTLSEANEAKIYGRAQVFGENRGPYIGAFDTVGADSSLTWVNWSTDVGYEQPLADVGALDIRAYADQHIVDRRLQLAPAGYTTPDRNGDGNVESFPDGVITELSYNAVTLGSELRSTLRLLESNVLVAGGVAEISGLPGGAFSLSANRDLQGAGVGNLGPIADLALPQNDPCALYGAQVGGFGACRLSLAGYVQDSWRVVESLQLTGGLRLSSFSDVNFDVLTHLTPRLGVVWTVVPDLTFKILAATAFRAPTFEEKYDQSSLAFADFSPGVHVGNPNLLPELIQTLDSGLTYDLSLGAMRYRLTGNGFFTRVSQSIEPIDESGNVEEIENAGGVDQTGLEGGARVEFPGGSYAYVNASWFRAYWKAVDEEGAPACAILPWEDSTLETCSLLTDVPQLRANLGVNVEIGELGTAHFLTQFGAERRNNVRSTLEQLRNFRIPPYALFHLSLRTRPFFDVVGLEGSLFNFLSFPLQDDVPRPDRVPGLLPREQIGAYAGVYLTL